MHTLTEENYLKNIYKLHIHHPDGVATNDIAEMVHTKAATVTDMVKKLADKNLLKHEKYHGVVLTDKGKKAALNIVRKHRLWEVFLVDILKFKWDEVHAIAEQLEHIQSDELIERLDKFLNYPKTDPHGDPIPDNSGKIKSAHYSSLSDLKTKERGLVSGVTEHTPAFLRYLEKSNLTLGNKIQVLEINEFDNSMDLKINQKRQIHISHDIAKNILIDTYE